MENKDQKHDYELITAFIGGNERSFNELIKKYQKAIYWHARRMVGNHWDADEVTQQVIIVIYKKISDFKFQSSLKTWIYKITSTRSLNLIKKRKIKQILRIEDSNSQNYLSSDDITLNYEDKESLEILNNLLMKLPDKQREVFILRHFENMTYEEISEITGKSVGTLKANYFHASKKILGNMSYER